MVEKFEIILNRINAEKQGVIFFGIFKMDEITDKWSIILVANWLSETNRNDGFIYIRNLMREILTEEEREQIARIGIFTSDEHIIDLLLNFKAGSRLVEQQVNGNLIHDGFVLASNRNIDSDVVPI